MLFEHSQTRALAPKPDAPARPTGGPSPLHVVITVNACWNIWNFRRPLVSALLAAGHRVTVLAPLDSAAAPLAALGCRVIDLPMNTKGLSPLGGAAMTARLYRHLRVLRPDVVLSFTIKNNIFGGFAAKAASVPFVPNVTGLGTAFLSGRWLAVVASALYKIAFSGLPVIFFQNDDDRQTFVGKRLVAARACRVIPGSGIDLAHFVLAEYPALARDGETTFLMIARVLRDKGVGEFAEAARIVRERHPNAQFVLLGPLGAANRTAISADQIALWEQTCGIRYIGARSDVREEIARAGCVVLPSYREGAPRTLIEAAAMGRPVIATDVAGCRSVVDDGETGFLCEVRSAASLAAAAERFLALDGTARARMGQNGRAKMEREFDQGLVIAAYHDAIRYVTSHQTRTARA